MRDDPFVLSLKIVMDNQYRTQAYINELLLDAKINDIEREFNDLKTKLLHSNSSRRIVYRDLNPDLSVQPVYNAKYSVKEHHRVAFTRFRVSAHSLAVEVGRWSRRGLGHLPLAERLCLW